MTNPGSQRPMMNVRVRRGDGAVEERIRMPQRFHRTNSSPTFSAKRRSFSPGRVLRHGRFSSIRRNIARGSIRGGSERKSGSTGSSRCALAASSLSGHSFSGGGLGYFFIHIQSAILQKEFTNFLLTQVNLVRSHQAFNVEIVLEIPFNPAVFQGVQFERDEVFRSEEHTSELQ